MDDYNDILEAAIAKPVRPVRRANYDEDSALDLIAQHESGGRNIRQQVVPKGGGYNPSVGRRTAWSDAFGPWQILNSTWRKRAPREISQKYPTVDSAPVEVQRQVARKIFRETGFQDWAPYNASLRRAIAQGQQPRSQYEDVLKAAQAPETKDDYEDVLAAAVPNVTRETSPLKSVQPQGRFAGTAARTGSFRRQGQVEAARLGGRAAQRPTKQPDAVEMARQVGGAPIEAVLGQRGQVRDEIRRGLIASNQQAGINQTPEQLEWEVNQLAQRQGARQQEQQELEAQRPEIDRIKAKLRGFAEPGARQRVAEGVFSIPASAGVRAGNLLQLVTGGRRGGELTKQMRLAQQALAELEHEDPDKGWGALAQRVLPQAAGEFGQMYLPSRLPVVGPAAGRAALPTLGALAEADKGFGAAAEGALMGELYHRGFQQLGKVKSPTARFGAATAVPSALAIAQGADPSRAILENTAFGAMALAGGRKPRATKIPESIRGVPEPTRGAEGIPRPAETVGVEKPQLGKSEINIPERPETIKAQLEARGFSLIPKDTPRPQIPQGYRAEKTVDGVVYYDPKRVDVETIRNTPTTKLLGHVEPKSVKTTTAVVARKPDGTEIQASAVSPENIEKQAAVTQANFPNAKVETGGPELAAQVIADRVAPENVRHVDLQRRLDDGTFAKEKKVETEERRQQVNQVQGEAKPTLAELAQRNQEARNRGELTEFDRQALADEQQQLRREDESLRQRSRADAQRIAEGGARATQADGGIARPLSDVIAEQRARIADRIGQIEAALNQGAAQSAKTPTASMPRQQVNQVQGTAQRIIPHDEYLKAPRNAKGEVDAAALLRPIEEQMDAAIKAGRKVEMVLPDENNKRIVVTKMVNGMAEDANGNRWGVGSMLFPKQGGAKDYIEISATPPPAQPDATSKYLERPKLGSREDLLSSGSRKVSLPEQRKDSGAFKTPAQPETAKAQPEGKPRLLQRYEEQDAATSFDKPQGLYTTPAEVESPHADLGGKRSTYELRSDARVLTIEPSASDRKAVVMRRMAVDAGAGVYAARRLLGDAKFAEWKKLTKPELIEKAKTIDPDMEWGRYYDTQEIMEGIGGVLARKAGYDAFEVKGDTPQWDEVVLLSRKAVSAQPETPKPSSVTPKRGGPRIEQLKTQGYIPVVRRQSKRGAIQDQSESVFFSPREPTESGLGEKDYGDALVHRVIDKTANIYKGNSSLEFAEERGLLSKSDPIVKKELGVDTLQEAIDKGLYPDGANPLDDGFPWYRALQQIAARELKKEGYQGAFWHGEDALSPNQYQIWDRSVLKRAGDVLSAKPAAPPLAQPETAPPSGGGEGKAQTERLYDLQDEMARLRSQLAQFREWQHDVALPKSERVKAEREADAASNRYFKLKDEVEKLQFPLGQPDYYLSYRVRGEKLEESIHGDLAVAERRAKELVENGIADRDVHASDSEGGAFLIENSSPKVFAKSAAKPSRVIDVTPPQPPAAAPRPESQVKPAVEAAPQVSEAVKPSVAPKDLAQPQKPETLPAGRTPPQSSAPSVPAKSGTPAPESTTVLDGKTYTKKGDKWYNQAGRRVGGIIESQLKAETVEGRMRERPTEAGFALVTQGRQRQVGPVLAEAQRVVTERPSRTRGLIAGIKTLPERLQTALISEFTPLRKLETELYGDRKLPMVDMARKFEQVAGAPAKAEADIIDFKKAVIDPIRQSADDFNSYLFLKRVEDRLISNPEQRRVASWTVGKAQQGLRELEASIGAEKMQQFREVGEVYQNEMRKALRLQVESGRMSEELYQRIVDSSDFYAPFKVLRYIEQGEGMSGAGRRIATTQALTKKITGIESEDFQIGNILQSSAEQIMRSRILAEKNIKMLELAKLTDIDPQGQLIRKVETDTHPRHGFEIVRYLEDGKPRGLEVSKDVAKAVQGMTPAQASAVAKVAMVTRRGLQWGATSANTAFQARNLFFADAPRQALLSRYGLRSPRDLYQWPMDWVYSLHTSMTGNFGKPNALFMEWLRSGAANSTIQRELTPQTFKPKPLGVSGYNPARFTLDSIAKFSNAIEETTKILGLKRGMRIENYHRLSPEQQKVVMEKIAVEVRNYSGSPDFLRKGSETRNLNLLFMFFNARMQGVAADARRLSGTSGTREAVVAWARLGAMVGIPATTLAIINNSPGYKEDYDKIPEWEKQNYFMIPRESFFTNEDTGERVRDYWRIPKRDIVQFFGNTIESGVRFGMERNPKEAGRWAVNLVENLSPVNIQGESLQERGEALAGSVNPILSKPAEVLTNRDFFRHRNIVPRYMEGVTPSEQYREFTPSPYKAVGRALNVSPLKVQHLTEGFTGNALGQFQIRGQQEGRSALGRFPFTRSFVRSGQVAEPETVSTSEEGIKTNQLQRMRERFKIQDQIRKGQDVDLDAAVESGRITESDRDRIEKETQLLPRVSRFENIQYPSQALDKYERMSEAQKEEVREIMQRKAWSLTHSDSLTQSQKDAFQERLDRLSITPVDPRKRESSNPFGEQFKKRFRQNSARSAP